MILLYPKYRRWGKVSAENVAEMKSKRILLPDNQLKKASISPMNALKSR
jgi:hypothetical protein